MIRSFFIALLTVFTLNAGNISIFGFQLGSKLETPENEKTVNKWSNDAVYKVVNKVSFERKIHSASTEPVRNEWVTIVFPYQESPQILHGKSISALIIDGLIESISFDTFGCRNQEEVLSELISKFGEPKSKEDTTVQTLTGASFNGYDVEWDLSYCTVIYHSMTRRIDEGSVTIDTVKGLEYRKKKQEEFAKNARPL